ncbi:alpha/beta hydrolase [Dokdonia pacifica]|uniref:AB hydrolase-1 domain-containing protein n=2 Tax=Dokdonia pacifica TaxID=1627892 RepID=A0A238WJ73_9FLAO|nr:alpha/beta hydrolase [Dokdonia pacifica]SNR46537.1 hypothetical protein SAMN06265376_1011130 [Dokdonia pacifica]
MPLVMSEFRANGLFKNTHFSTIYSAKIRQVKGVHQERERVTLPDGDFVDIDWSYTLSRKRTQKVALLFHGLEGNAQRTYMLAMAKLLIRNGYDVAAVNFRGCSGSDNLLYRSYHSGETDDMRFIIQMIAEKDLYNEIFLYGVSLGGNALLKYAGEKKGIPSQVKAIATVGVPADLKASLEQLNYSENWVYRTSFLVDLRGKYRKKMVKYPELMTSEVYATIKTLKDFDDVYTAPAHGFKNALDYYEKASSFELLPEIELPTLILNAKNDSFLHGDCYPYEHATSSNDLFLETPDHGGHVGFYKRGEFYYSEQRTLDFFEEKTP